MRNQAFLKKLLVALTLLLLVPISVVTVFSYSSITSYAEDEIGEFNAFYLRSMSQTVEVMVDALIDSAMNATMSEKISRLSFLPSRSIINSGPETVACINAFNLLNELVMTNGNLFSAYLYIDDSQYILASDIGMSKLEQFYDLEWLGHLPDPGTGSISWMDTRVAGNPQKGYGHVVTFLCPLQSYVSNMSGAIVFNVKEEAFSTLFGAYGSTGSANVAIAKADGTVMAAQNKAVIGKPMEAEPFGVILERPAATGYFIQKSPDEVEMISYHRSAGKGWIYIGRTSVDPLLERSRGLQVQMVLFNLLLALLALVAVYFIAIRYTSPLSHLISEVRKRSEGSQQGGDFALLTRTYTSLLSEEKRLVQLRDERKQDAHRRILTDLLMGKPSEEETGIAWPACVAVMLIDDEAAFRARYPTDQRFYMRNMLMTLCTQMAVPDWQVQSLLYENRQMVLVFSAVNDTGALLRRMGEFRESAAANLELSVTVGIGLPAADSSGIQTSYREAVDAARGRLLHGPGGCFLHSPPDKELPYYFPLSQERQLISQLRIGNVAGADEALSGFFAAVREYERLTPDNAAQILNQLAGVLMKHMVETHLNTSLLMPDGGNPFLQIGAAETLEQAEADSHALLARLAELSLQEDTADHTERMLQYIKRNYTHDFGIEELADSIGLSYSHARRLFKSAFGKTITEFLNEYRIELARELLENPAVSIASVARQVGYNNEQSFYRFFKKYHGVTPSEYRKRLRQS